MVIIPPSRVQILMYSSMVLGLGGLSVASAASCFDGSSLFHPDQWAHCQDITGKGEIFLYYNPSESDGNLMLGLHATNHATGGWSALAIGGNGGMKGASQIVVRQVDNEWIVEDRHSNDYVTPTLDEEQNIRLLFAQQQDGSTAWGVMVMMNSCDEENDYAILDNDTSRWMHWALGSSHDFAYHGSNRGQFHANLLESPRTEPDLTGLPSFEITMPNVPVVLGAGGDDPSNPYICSFFDLAQLLPGGFNVNDKHHGVHMAPVINDASADYVHHVLLFSCDARAIAEDGVVHQQVVEQCQSMPPGCSEIKFAWAVGGQDITLPPNVGVPFGEGDNWLVLQMHYYNPSLDENVRDSSGVRVYMSSTLQQQDAGFLELNGGTGPDQRASLEAGQSEIALSPFVVPGSADCTGKWEQPLNVLAAIHHLHTVGTKMRIDVQRNGTFVGTVRDEHHYDFNHQSFEETAVKTLLPGDQMNVFCTYDTSKRSQATSFGDLSQQEMCYGLIFYYPRQPQMESFGYIGPPADGLIAICQSPGKVPFDEVSLCAQAWATDLPSYYGFGPDEGSYSAADFCNGLTGSQDVQQFAPIICPLECHSSQNCTDSDTARHAQIVHCPSLCSEFLMTVYPDMSRPFDESIVGVWCDGNLHDNDGDTYEEDYSEDDDDGWFGYIRRPSIVARPQCELVGDLSKAANFVLVSSDGDETASPTSAPVVSGSSVVSKRSIGVVVLMMANAGWMAFNW